MLNECNGCEYQCKLSHIDICTLGSPCPHQRSTPMTNEELWETLSENMSDTQKYYYVAVDPHTSKKSCLAFLKLLKKRAERIDHVCGRLIEEMEKEIHE